MTHASDPLNIIKTRSESTCGELHLHCTTTPAYLCYTTATALKPDGNTPREDLEEKVSLTHKTEKERWCVLEPRIQRVVPRGACSSRSPRCLLFTDGHLVGLLRVAADPRCVPCFAPSFPESTGGPAYTRLGLFTVQPQSSEDTPRQIAHTNTHAALQLTVLHHCNGSTAAAAKGLTTD